MSLITWQEQFRDRLLGLEAPETGSWLAQALRHQRLSEDEYLSWARQHMGYAILQRAFFQEQTPNPQLLEKLSLPWSEELVPVGEWDGQLLVAGLEKPSELAEENAPAIFVLASFEDLTQWWSRLQETPASESVEMPEGLFGEAQTLISNPPAAKASSSGLDFSGLSLGKTEGSAAAPVAAPAPVVQTKTETQPPPVVETPLAALTSEASVKEDISNSDIVIESSLGEQSNPRISIEKTYEDVTMTKTVLTADEPKQPIAVKLNASAPITKEKVVLSMLLNSNPDVLPAAEKAFSFMRIYFDKVMLLALSETGDGMLPLLWSEAFHGSPTPEKIPLAGPSLFKIMQTSEKPYHGYVVENHINDSFFKTWNNGDTPAHVTLVPVFYKGRLVGGLLGLGPVQAYSLPVLRFSEKLAAEFTKSVGGAINESLAA